MCEGTNCTDWNAHLDILKWAREMKCSWGNACELAARNSRLKILKLVKRKRSP